MAGSISYSEKCICGAIITLAETFEFIGTERLSKQFLAWQQKHSHCLPTFIEIQGERLKLLKEEG